MTFYLLNYEMFNSYRKLQLRHPSRLKHQINGAPQPLMILFTCFIVLCLIGHGVTHGREFKKRGLDLAPSGGHCSFGTHETASQNCNGR